MHDDSGSRLTGRRAVLATLAGMGCAHVLVFSGLATSGALADTDTPAPPHGAWRVTSIGDVATDREHRPTFAFDADGRFTGQACNTFTGTYSTDGARLAFGPIAATRMACAEPLMSQESALFTALERVTAFHLVRDGALWLSDDDGNTLITAVR